MNCVMAAALVRMSASLQGSGSSDAETAGSNGNRASASGDNRPDWWAAARRASAEVVARFLYSTAPASDPAADPSAGYRARR